MRQQQLFVGLISGTSADAVDAALIEYDAGRVRTRAALAHPFEPVTRSLLTAALADPGALRAREFGRLHAALGEAFADAALTLLGQAGVAPSDVAAIGSHGQTLYHEPGGKHAFTLQAGDPARIARRTGITTVADFRSADVAAGGEGAPLAPLLHAALFASPDEARAVINLGGIANVTLLRDGAAVTGFDTGPANTLMDTWAALTGNGPRDTDGRIAAAGTVDAVLLERLLDEPYFERAAPKSTGREHFDRRWLLERLDIDAGGASRLQSGRVADIMATLSALTAQTIAAALRGATSDGNPADWRLFACGGGCHNPELLGRIADACGVDAVGTTAEFGVDPDAVEAVLFAWLAAARLERRPLDTRAITGARHPIVAGAVHAPPPGTAS